MKCQKWTKKGEMVVDVDCPADNGCEKQANANMKGYRMGNLGTGRCSRVATLGCHLTDEASICWSCKATSVRGLSRVRAHCERLRFSWRDIGTAEDMKGGALHARSSSNSESADVGHRPIEPVKFEIVIIASDASLAKHQTAE
jgi:hypothetical protein